MKTKYLLVILPILLISIQLRTIAQIDKEQAINIIKSNLTNEELQDYNVLIYPNLIQSQEFYLSPYHVLHSEYDKSWLFFIDIYPTAQWDHNCMYFFLDQQTGDYTTINYRIPPQDYWYGWDYESILEEGQYMEVEQINDLSPGIYLVAISFNNVIVDSGKLVIAK